MADPAPFFSRTDSAESETPNLEKQHPSLDDTIERCIGDFGWAQFLQAVLVSFAWLFDAQQTFISVFSDAHPTKWHCTQLSDESCNSAANICQLPKNSWAWDLPVHTSVISEWSLECAGSIVTGLPASSFFVGCLAGGLVLATLADSSLGRKNMLLLSCLLMALAGVLTVVSTNIWIYSALRFLSGFGRSTIGTCALVLSTELVGKRWRGQVGIIGFLCFTLGFLSLPAIAYLNRSSSWRLLYLWTCIPTIFYCVLVHLFVRESPRWLYVRGRRDEFVATLKSIAPESISFSESGVSIEHDEDQDVDLYSAIRMLLEKSWAIRRLSAVMVVGFGMGMVYYGMPLGLGSLAFNLYLSVTFNALSELPASMVTFFLIGRLNRKSSLLGFTTISGVCSVMCVVMREYVELQICLEMVSFFSACTAFNTLLIYTLELFPTCVRNSAVSMVRQAVVLGGVFSPMMVAAGRENGLVSYGVFGVTIGCCGLFVGCLPETKGGTLCDTMDEEERKESTSIYI
uniref:Putative organic cation/carnitine transporter 3-like n=1 Tax=Davidia involucrata TaxID=16924 RepID=A0A5B7BBC3_DAVIN